MTIPESVPSRLDFEPCQRCTYVSDGMRYFRRGRWLCAPCWGATFGPDVNLPKLLGWVHEGRNQGLFWEAS